MAMNTKKTSKSNFRIRHGQAEYLAGHIFPAGPIQVIQSSFATRRGARLCDMRSFPSPVKGFNLACESHDGVIYVQRNGTRSRIGNQPRGQQKGKRK